MIVTDPNYRASDFYTKSAVRALSAFVLHDWEQGAQLLDCWKHRGMLSDADVDWVLMTIFGAGVAR